MNKLPFAAGTFWKTLVVVVALVVVSWLLALWLTDYKMTPADWGGTIICTVLLSYLVHLWLLPADESTSEDESPPDEE